MPMRPQEQRAADDDDVADAEHGDDHLVLLQARQDDRAAPDAAHDHERAEHEQPIEVALVGEEEEHRDRAEDAARQHDDHQQAVERRA